jgi:protein-S-isoprenylcysteine O-methyltransferase Ste14
LAGSACDRTPARWYSCPEEIGELAISDQPARRILPPVYLAIAVVAILACHLVLPLARFIAFPVTLIGLLPIAAGVALNLSADAAFKARGTTVKPFERSSSLVTKGVFGLSRNPMYLGMALLLLGLALLLGTLTPFVIVLAFAVLLDLRFIRAEERMLAETFGDDWQAYRRRVRRWL